MDFELSVFSPELILAQAAAEIENCSAVTEKYGISITPQTARNLAVIRGQALKETGRIEFGSGVTGKLIKAFCDSPYITRQNFEQTIGELTELFYSYKNETRYRLSDDELIAFMKDRFDGVCGGSIELLGSRDAERMARSLRFGGKALEEENLDVWEENEENV